MPTCPIHGLSIGFGCDCPGCEMDRHEAEREFAKRKRLGGDEEGNRQFEAHMRYKTQRGLRWEEEAKKASTLAEIDVLIAAFEPSDANPAGLYEFMTKKRDAYRKSDQQWLAAEGLRLEHEQQVRINLIESLKKEIGCAETTIEVARILRRVSASVAADEPSLTNVADQRSKELEPFERSLSKGLLELLDELVTTKEVVLRSDDTYLDRHSELFTKRAILGFQFTDAGKQFAEAARRFGGVELVSSSYKVWNPDGLWDKKLYTVSIRLS